MTTPPTPEAVEAHKLDTPRTEYEWEREQDSPRLPREYVRADFARTLERELNASRAEIERLRARVAELEGELKNRHAEYAKALNRRCTVEDVLYDVAAGKRDLLTREECRELAIKLGVPPAEPKTKP